MKGKSWIENTEFLLTNQRFVCANVWDKRQNLICAFVEKTPEELKEKILKFLSNWEQQKFKIIFRTASTQALESGFVHFIDTEETSAEKIQIQAPEIMQGANLGDIEERINKGILQGLKQIEFDRKLYEVEEKEKELKTTAGQFSILMKELAINFLPQFQKSLPMQGTNEIEILNDVNDLEIKKAIEIILLNTERNDIIKIANAIQNNPNLIKKALMFI